MSFKNLFFSGVVLLFLSGCEESIETVCNQDFPQFQQEVSLASNQIQEFRGPVEKKGGRMIASATEPKSLDDEQKEYWKSWGVDRLKEIQGFQEAFRESGDFDQISDTVTQAADQLVLFFGYVDHNEIEAMSESLLKVVDFQGQIHAKVCKNTENK